MHADWKQICRTAARQKIVSVLSLCLLFANATTYLLYLHLEEQGWQLESEINGLEHNIRSARDSVSIFEEFGSRRTEIERWANQEVLGLGDALNRIAPTAAALGISAVSFQVGEINNRWRGSRFIINETNIKLTIDSRDERQALFYIAELERQWGGRIEVRQVHIVKSNENDIISSILKHEVTFTWSSLQSAIVRASVAR